jgi:hypothetical protein
MKLKAPLRDEHAPTNEGRARIRVEGIAAPFGLGVLAWFFLTMTVLLAILTAREFLA